MFWIEAGGLCRVWRTDRKYGCALHVYWRYTDQVYWNERERKLIDNLLIKKVSLAELWFNSLVKKGRKYETVRCRIHWNLLVGSWGVW
jgi:hypothetical protein